MLEQDVAFLLKDFGSDLLVTRPADATYNPATGTLTGGADTDYSVRGVFINYEDGKVDGTVVRMGDRRLLVAARNAGNTPAIGDRVDGLTILDVRTIAPNGTTIAWTCQARK